MSSFSPKKCTNSPQKKEKKIIALTPREIELISKHKERIYKFDLSQINSKTFDSLIAFFKEEFEFGVDGLGFCNDFLVETIRTKEREQIENPCDDAEFSYPYILEQSVAKTRKGLATQLIEGLQDTILRSATLFFLKFRFIPFQQTDFDLLSNAILNANSIRVFKLCDVQLGDKQFGKMSRALRKMNVEEVQFRKCYLTDDIAYDMRTFLSFHSFSKSEFLWKNKMLGKNKKHVQSIHSSYLKYIDLRENNFTESFVSVISDSLKELSPLVFDLRGNDEIKKSPLLRNIQKIIPKCDIRIGYCKPPKYKLFPQTTSPIKELSSPSKLDLPKLPNSDNMDFSNPLAINESASERSQNSSKSSISLDNKVSMRIIQLEEENERLSRLIEQLENNTNIVELEPDLYIIGEQSQEFVERICKLDSLLVKTDNGPMPFLMTSRELYLSKKKEVKLKHGSKKKTPQKLKRKI